MLQVTTWLQMLMRIQMYLLIELNIQIFTPKKIIQLLSRLMITSTTINKLTHRSNLKCTKSLFPDTNHLHIILLLRIKIDMNLLALKYQDTNLQNTNNQSINPQDTSHLNLNTNHINHHSTIMLIIQLQLLPAINLFNKQPQISTTQNQFILLQYLSQLNQLQCLLLTILSQHTNLKETILSQLVHMKHHTIHTVVVIRFKALTDQVYLIKITRVHHLTNPPTTVQGMVTIMATSHLLRS